MTTTNSSAMLLLAVTVAWTVLRMSEQCSYDGLPYQDRLSSNGPYRSVSNKSFDEISFAGCSAGKAWMMIRHGTRNPKAKEIRNMRERLAEIKARILEDGKNEFIKPRDMDLIAKWKTKLQEDDQMKLTHEGESEMLLMAERMQSRFPDIFPPVYSNTSYAFKYTDNQRTRKSALYFATGLFGRSTAKDVWFPVTSNKDPVLRFYKMCEKWEQTVKSSPENKDKRQKFLKGREMRETLERVRDRLNHDELEIEDLVIMYKTCALETAWNQLSKSPWCSVYTLDEFKVLEYAEDLKYYWKDGYGQRLTYQQACPAFGDMMEFLTSVEEYPKASAYFTHSGTLLKLLAHLGLYRDDEPLTAENFERMESRKWRTSLIDTFATNLAFVSFECGKEKKILTMHQENIVRLPACPHSDLCDVKKIKEFYSESLDRCDLKEMCRI